MRKLGIMEHSDKPCEYELANSDKCLACGDEFRYIEDVIRPRLCDRCLEEKNDQDRETQDRQSHSDCI